MENLTEEQIQEAYNFLDDLRESGATNMFGAGPYIEATLGYSKRVSRELLISWMKQYGS